MGLILKLAAGAALFGAAVGALAVDHAGQRLALEAELDRQDSAALEVKTEAPPATGWWQHLCSTPVCLNKEKP